MWDAAPHGQLSTGGVHATFGTPRPAPPGNTGVLRVTSAAGAKFGFKAANLTLPIDPACATAACERSSINGSPFDKEASWVVIYSELMPLQGGRGWITESPRNRG